MHVQTLSSGSKGNSTLVRAGETHLLVDAGLPAEELFERLERARVAPRRVDHVLLTHGHLDHARGSGTFARKTGAGLYCSERLMSNASVRRAPEMRAFTIGRAFRPDGPRGNDDISVLPVEIPHDAKPTVAFRLQHGERTAIVVTDMGRPDPDAARALAGAHLVVLEFNHDRDLLASGPYTHKLKRRVAGNRGHLSNEEAAEMLKLVAGPELHTLVLAHLSETNNTPALAEAAARAALDELGLGHVEVHVAGQDDVGPNLEV